MGRRREQKGPGERGIWKEAFGRGKKEEGQIGEKTESAGESAIVSAGESCHRASQRVLPESNEGIKDEFQ